MSGWKFATAALLLFLFVACSGGGSPNSSTAVVGRAPLDCATDQSAASNDPPNDSTINAGRVAVRSGQIALDGAQAEFNFSVVLPAGWWIAERFSANPSDAAAGEIWNAGGPVIRYEAQSGPPELPFNVQRRQHIVTQECVGGVEATFFEPAPDTTGSGYEKGILFEDLPGSPVGATKLPLVISSLPGRPEVQNLVLDVALTVRFAPPPEPPAPAEPAVTPGPDWTRVNARTGLASTANFSLELPPGWTVEERIGIDTLVGSFHSDEIEIYYDFGGFAASPEAAQTGIFHWQEQSDGETIHLFRPTSEQNHLDYEFTTGAYFPLLPGSGPNSSNVPLFLSASGLVENQQEIVLAIVRTIRDAELDEAR